MSFNLNKDQKIYVAGHTGLIGSAFIRYFKVNGFNNVITQSKSKLDLTSAESTNNFFKNNHPEVVILSCKETNVLWLILYVSTRYKTTNEGGSTSIWKVRAY